MSFHKKETEKIELVARPETDQTQLNLLTDMVENNYLKKTPDQVRTTRDIFFHYLGRGKRRVEVEFCTRVSVFRWPVFKKTLFVRRYAPPWLDLGVRGAIAHTI